MTGHRELALFRLEGTMVADSIGLMERAAEAANFSFDEVTDTPIGHARHVLSALSDSSEDDQTVIEETIRRHAAEIVSPWVFPVIKSQFFEHKRELAIAADFTVACALRGIARGLEDNMPGLKIPYLRPSSVEEAIARKRGINKLGSVAILADRLKAKGLRLGVVAAGSRNALRPLGEAKRPLVVNSPVNLPVPGEHAYTARLDWKVKKPHMVHFAWPGQHRADEYDLSDAADLQGFTEEVTEALE